ncbi:MAG: rubrerythrin family protein [Chloroflexota bacterium]
MGTSENLAAAFAGESQANRKYLAFAKKAEADGFVQVARLFRAAAEAETVHAQAHFRVMNGVKGTVENLKAAIEGEGYEFKTMYPEFIAEAETEGNRPALATFRNANAVEKVHHELYSAALQAVEAGQDLPKAEIYVCPVCGYTVSADAPDRCPVCGTQKARFGNIA